MRQTSKIFFQILGLLYLTVGSAGGALMQSNDRPALVVQAVAPLFPPLAVAAAQDGTVLIDLHLSPKGNVESTDIVGGPKLLQKVVEIAARRWIFSTAESATAPRIVRLSFIFRLVQKDTPSEELLPIFRPPYQVEVRTRFPSIGKYTKQTHQKRR
jgi:Gram-negative bacterial TonB protein C-terminal